MRDKPPLVRHLLRNLLVNRCMELRENELDKLTVTESARSRPSRAARRRSKVL